MKVALMNTTIATTPGQYELSAISADEAREMIRRAGGWESAIGHESTAAALSLLLGEEIPVNRIRFEQEAGQTAVCLRVKGRVAEGQVLDLEQLEEIGYDLFALKKSLPVMVTRPVEIDNLAGPYETLSKHPANFDGFVEAMRSAAATSANCGPSFPSMVSDGSGRGVRRIRRFHA